MKNLIMWTSILAGSFASFVASADCIIGATDCGTPLPEPGTLGLIVAGIAGIAATRRLRRK